MIDSFIVILPPLLTLLVAFTTQRIYFALILGIIVSEFIATNFSIYKTCYILFDRTMQTSEISNLTSIKNFLESNNLLIAIFLFILGIIMALIKQTGGLCAYNNFINKKFKTKKQVELATLSLSSFLFIDDYFSCLVSGSVMQTITDKFKIPRVKLAFLIDSIACPICAIVPISSWIAAITSNLKNSGITDKIDPNTIISADTFWTYLNTIPFTFYSFIMIFSVWFIVIKQISFGLMAKHEMIAQSTGDLFGGKKVNTDNPTQDSSLPTFCSKQKSSLFDFILPLALIFLLTILILLYTGNYFLFGGNNNLIKAVQESEISKSLFLSGFLTLVISIIYYISHKKLKFKNLKNIFFDGIKVMTPAITVLFLAWLFGNVIKNDLQTGQYLAKILTNYLKLELLPLIFFLTAGLTSFATGSCWGTMAILIPIAVPMVPALLNLNQPIAIENISIIFPVLGAIISGGTFGDHVSPISESALMSSISSGSNHLDHIKTQLVYAVPIMLATCLSFLASGFLIKYGLLASIFIPMLLGIGLSFIFLKILNSKN